MCHPILHHSLTLPVPSFQPILPQRTPAEVGLDRLGHEDVKRLFTKFILLFVAEHADVEQLSLLVGLVMAGPRNEVLIGHVEHKEALVNGEVGLSVGAEVGAWKAGEKLRTAVGKGLL